MHTKGKQMADQIQVGEEGARNAHEVIPQELYCNGVQVGLSLSDMSVTIMMDGQGKCKLHMSFTTAKTFALQLNNAVKEFERLTNHSIMTMDDVDKALKPLRDQGSQDKDK